MESQTIQIYPSSVGIILYSSVFDSCVQSIQTFYFHPQQYNLRHLAHIVTIHALKTQNYPDIYTHQWSLGNKKKWNKLFRRKKKEIKYIYSQLNLISIIDFKNRIIILSFNKYFSHVYR